ncbi:hypothetical protein Tco_0743914, partial [Tanacetum coccineum]
DVYLNHSVHALRKLKEKQGLAQQKQKQKQKQEDKLP